MSEKAESTRTKAVYHIQRIEKKFWMTAEQYRELCTVLEVNMEPDRYGKQTICNVYYDTPDYTLIRNSVEMPPFKEKLRLRCYNFPNEDSTVYVEVKKKLNGVGFKRRIAVPFSEAKKLLEGEPIHSSQPQIEGELREFIHRYTPEPKVLLVYDRAGMWAKDDHDFRVTIDTNLKYRLTDPGEPSPEGLLPVMEDESMCLMEIKASGGIPSWLRPELERLKIYQAPFSKVGMCFTKYIAPNLHF